MRNYQGDQRPQNRGGGGDWEQVPLHFLYLGKKVPFFGNESALFLWNRSAVLAKLKCPFWSVPHHFRGVSAASVKVEDSR